jgi:hypothetical protein
LDVSFEKNSRKGAKAAKSAGQKEKGALASSRRIASKILASLSKICNSSVIVNRLALGVNVFNCSVFLDII